MDGMNRIRPFLLKVYWERGCHVPQRAVALLAPKGFRRLLLGNGPLGRPTYTWQEGTKVDNIEISYESVDWIRV
jgi:hypothetical protein